MQNHPNKKKRKFWGSWRCNMLLIVATIFAMYSVISSVSEYRLAREKFKNSEEDLSNLNQNKERLENSLASISTEFGQEQAIRDKFNVVKDGEGLIIIVDEKKGDGSGASSESGFFSFIKSWFD